MFPRPLTGRSNQATEDIEEAEKVENDPLIACPREASALSLQECWICLTDDDRSFLRPCMCRGSTKYVHRDCFESFIKSKNLSNLKCNFCKASYRIEIPYQSFITLYELLSRINGHICTWVFILAIALIAYTVLFLYGIAAIIAIIGTDDFNTYIVQEMILSRYIFRLCKLMIGAPMIPVYLCFTVNQRFTLATHLLPSLLVVDSLSFSWCGLYATLATYYVYKRAVKYVEDKLGMCPQRTGGIIINNHQIAIKEMVCALLLPFVGNFVGRAVERPSLVGIGVFVVVKDFVSISYLVCKNRIFDSIKVIEYKND